MSPNAPFHWRYVFALLIVWLPMEAFTAPPPLSINVREHGAKGDGKADDTAAIQVAINEGGRLAKTFPFPWAGGYPEVVFPEGTYLISRPLVWGLGADPAKGMQTNGRPWSVGAVQGAGFTYARGIGRAVIKQTDPSQDIFYIGHAYRAVVEGLAFEGGYRGIRLWNGNHDKCVVLIRDCTFSKTMSFAVEMTEIHVSLPGKNYVGFALADSSGRLTEVQNPAAAPLMFSSTYLHVYGCEFRACRGVLSSACDMATLEDSTIETSPEMEGAAIRTVGLLKVEHVRGLARVKAGRQQRWMDLAFGNSPQIYGRGLKLETEGELGMPVVYSFARLRGTGNVNCASVVLQDCEFAVSGCPENAVVHCLEVPNRIVLSGCVQTGKTPVAAIGLAGSHFDEDYFQSYDNIGSLDLTPLTNRGAWIPVAPQALAYLVDDGNRNIAASLPAVMAPYSRPALPKATQDAVRRWTSLAKSDFLGEKTLTSTVTRRVLASDFGLVGDGIADDSDAVQKAFDAAAGEGICELVFPGALYLITRPIRLPSRIIVRGSGRAAFLTPSGVAGGFVVPDARVVALLNLTFDSGKKQVQLRIRRGQEARVLVDNCAFQNAGEIALECRSEDEAWAARSRSRLRAMNCVFDNNGREIDQNVEAVVDSHWIGSYKFTYREFRDVKTRTAEGYRWDGPFQGTEDYRERALVRNEGRLRIENVVGVPSAKTFRREIRWMDTRGPLLVDFFRFGGENGGLPAVYLEPGAPDLGVGAIIQNSWLNHKLGSFYYPGDPEAVKPIAALVYARDLSENLVLANNCGFEKSQIPAAILGPTVQFDPSRVRLEDIKTRLSFSANTIPEDLATRVPGESAAAVVVTPIPPERKARSSVRANLLKNGDFEKTRTLSIEPSTTGGWGEVARRGSRVGLGAGGQEPLPKDWTPNPNAGWAPGSRSRAALITDPSGKELRSGTNAILLGSDQYAVLLSDAPIAVSDDPWDRELSLTKPNRFSFWAKGSGRLTLSLTTYLKVGVQYNACRATPAEINLDSAWKKYEGTLEFTDAGVVEARCFLRVTGGEAVVDGVEIRGAP